MNLTGLPLLLSLVGTVRWTLQVNHNMSFVQSVLERAADEERWTNTPIFVGHHVNPYTLSPLIIWLQRELATPTYIFHGRPGIATGRQLRNYIKSDTLSVLFCHSSKERIWLLLDHKLRKLRMGRLIISLSEQRSDSFGELQALFKKLWQLQFLQVLVLHNGIIYSYKPYPTLRYYRVLHNASSLFAPRHRDLMGYVVSTPAENDLPRVFFIKDQITGRPLIRGFGYKIFVEFLNRHNATLRISNAKDQLSVHTNVDMNNITKRIGKNELEISLHPYTGIDERLGILSYPMLKAQNCLIMPVRNEIPRFMYLMRPFSWDSWLLLLCSIFVIGLALYWLSPTVSGSRWQRVSLSLLESLTQLLFLSLPRRMYYPNLRYFLVALQLAILGFFVTNWYSNQLSSFLTALVVGQQVNSFEELIVQQQRILVKKHEVPFLMQQVPPDLQPQVRRLIDSVDASEQVTALLSFNRTYSYPFTEERWQFFALQQQYAHKPIYRYSSVCLGSPIIAYPMRKDSHLESPLKYFIMHIQSTGLFQYWLVSDFKDALKAGYVRLIDNQLTFKPLDLDTLRLAWFVALTGWLTATLAFTWEYVRAS